MEKMDEVIEIIKAKLIQIKYYITLILGLVSCVSSFVFMFLVPFLIEPSIATLVANFDPDPVVCRTVFVEHHSGLTNCSWSSCRRGCTIDQVECDRIYVDYMMIPYSEYPETENDDEEGVWTIRGTPVFVNIKACGYPPRTNCTEFSDKHVPLGAVFPCYYSRANPSLVITDYSWAEAVQYLVGALIIPNLLTGVSLGILSYWWYPGCQKKSCQYEMPPDQEALDSQQGDEDEDTDEKEDLNEEDDEGGGEQKQSGDDKKSEKEQLAIEMTDEKV